MAADAPRTLVMVRRFEASPQRVFEAWTSPATMSLWLFTAPGESEQHSCEIDLRPGGQWTIADRRAGVDYTAHGEYLEVEPPRRLVLTFGMRQFSPNFDTLQIDLEADGDGCRMTFTQSGADIAEELGKLPRGGQGDTEHGWNLMFLALAAVARGETPTIPPHGGHP